MDEEAARAEILERIHDLTEYQLAHLLKRGEEAGSIRYDWLDLSPQSVVGPIDVAGYAHVFHPGYHGRHAIAVGRWETDPTVRDIRDFARAADCHEDSEMASLVNAAESYEVSALKPVSNALERAYDGSMVIPPVLYTADKLRSLAMMPETGIEADPDDDSSVPESEYAIDEAFWRDIERIGTDALISRAEVPRADSLAMLGRLVETVADGDRHRPSILDTLQSTTETVWTLRQVGYYITAAEALDLLAEGPLRVDGRTGRTCRFWTLTADGERSLDLLRSDRWGARDFLTECIRELDIVQEAVDCIQTGEGHHEELQTLVRERTELSGMAADRRAETLGRWFDQWHGPVTLEDGDPPTYTVEL